MEAIEESFRLQMKASAGIEVHTGELSQLADELQLIPTITDEMIKKSDRPLGILFSKV